MKRYTIPLQETLKPIWQKFTKNKPKIIGEFADKKDTFKLEIKGNYFATSEILYFGTDSANTDRSFAAKITTKPKRKWYKLIIQYLTFGLYKAPWEYKIKLL